MSARGQCPSCGGQVEFRFERAFVASCTYCGSTVVRTDRGLKDLGKHSDVVASESSLEPFRKGVYRGVSFTLMGRVVLAHPKGGRWSEWFASMEDGTLGWLAEAQGAFTFQEAYDDADAVESLRWQNLSVGTVLTLAGRDFTVTERSTKTAVLSEGEVPFVPLFDQPEPFADLTAGDGTVATLDFSVQPPLLFVGRRVRLDELGLEVRAGRRDAREVAAASLACGNCGGPIRLHAPDATRRVTCAACGSLHEVEGTSFRFLETLAQGARPAIALGKRFTFEATEWQVVGWMERSVTSQGIRYPWHEYLAYDAAKGFRYLVESKGHWLWAEPDLAATRSIPVDSLSSFEEDGERFTLFAHDEARVDAVAGEFPWEVAVGETVEAFDYVSPPLGLSCELDGNEVNWSRCHGLERAIVRQLFPGVSLPPEDGVGMLQPNPYRGTGRIFFCALVGAFTLLLAVLLSRPSRSVSDETLTLPPHTQEMAMLNEGVVVVTKPFELQGGRRLTFAMKLQLPQSAYADVVGDLLDAHDVVVGSFRAASFWGTDDDGDPSGVIDATANLGHVEPGAYRLRLDVVASAPDTKVVEVHVDEGGVSPGKFALYAGLALLLALPFGILGMVFEARRRASSDFSASGRRMEGSGSSDDDSSSSVDDDDDSGGSDE